MIQRIPGFPKTKKVRERRVTYGPQEWVQRLEWSRLGLTQVPTGVGKLVQLSQLRDLLLTANQLTRVPPELGRLSQLEGLDLNDNQLTAVPVELGQLSQLRWLDLSGNPALPGARLMRP